MVTIEGKYGISATVLADSESAVTGDRMVTYEVEYPRIILAELNTHRQLPKNSHSSRAIPFNKMATQLTGRPVRFGTANPGMQDKGEEHDGYVFLPVADLPGSGVMDGYESDRAWLKAREAAIEFSRAFFEGGFHKQVYNRLTEPFQMMRTVISGTEWGNFFWLRHDGAADPTLQELARVMLEARRASEPMLLHPGEWHLPYVSTQRGMFPEDEGTLYYYIGDKQWLSPGEAVKVSAARSAAVSFRNEDYGLEKCLEVHARLVGDERKHASAFEHQCTPMEPEQERHMAREYGVIDFENSVNIAWNPGTWQEGITHMDRKRNLWSGPLKGFIQYRKLIPGECYEGNLFD
jgi:hypothetical protein